MINSRQQALVIDRHRVPYPKRWRVATLYSMFADANNTRRLITFEGITLDTIKRAFDNSTAAPSTKVSLAATLKELLSASENPRAIPSAALDAFINAQIAQVVKPPLKVKWAPILRNLNAKRPRDYNARLLSLLLRDIAPMRANEYIALAHHKPQYIIIAEHKYRVQFATHFKNNGARIIAISRRLQAFLKKFKPARTLFHYNGVPLTPAQFTALLTRVTGIESLGMNEIRQAYLATNPKAPQLYEMGITYWKNE